MTRTATSVADPSRTATAIIEVAHTAITGHVSPSNASLPAGGTYQFVATVDGAGQCSPSAGRLPRHQRDFRDRPRMAGPSDHHAPLALASNRPNLEPESKFEAQASPRGPGRARKIHDRPESVVIFWPVVDGIRTAFWPARLGKDHADR